MPTYEYLCDNCGHRLEQFQNMSDAPVKSCPQCGGKVRRLIGTGAAVIFKGSGLHSTDYRSSSRPSCGRATGPAAVGTRRVMSEGVRWHTFLALYRRR